MEYKSFSKVDLNFEVKVDLKSGQWQGYAAVFGNRDSGGDIIMPGAFTKTLAERGPDGTGKIKCLWEHYEPFGRLVSAKEDDFGLFIVGQATMDAPENKGRLAFMADGVVDEMSIGYSVPAGKATYEDDDDFMFGTRVIHEIKLYECSPVLFAMNELAAITGVAKSQELGMLLKSFGREPLLRQAKSLEGVDMKVVEEAIEALTAAHVELYGDDETKKLYARMQRKEAAERQTTEQPPDPPDDKPEETPPETPAEPAEGGGSSAAGEEDNRELDPEEKQYLQSIIDGVGVGNYLLTKEVDRLKEGRK